jgi:hypothetical protein
MLSTDRGKMRSQPIIWFFATLIVLFLMHSPKVDATSVLEVSLDAMLQESELVFEGTAISIEAKQNGPKRIHTYITFEIKDIIKGEYPSKTITLRFLGGTTGDVTMAVSDMRLPQQGEHGIYFVESLKRFQVNPLYGWSQGHFIVEKDATGTERVMTNRRLRITEVKPKEQKNLSNESRQAISGGILRDLVVTQTGQINKGLTVDEFKEILRKRMEKK